MIPISNCDTKDIEKKKKNVLKTATKCIVMN